MENYAFESILTDPSGSGASGVFLHSAFAYWVFEQWVLF